MNKRISLFLSVFCLFSSFTFGQSQIEEVISFEGIQVTGVTVSDKGRIFANFPRWRDGIPFSVVEVIDGGISKPFPNTELNTWKPGDQLLQDRFVCVQSVMADGDYLYVLDTMNPLFAGIIATPRVYVYNLLTDQLIKTYVLSSAVKSNSYVNDLRIDRKRGKMYLTDSGEAGIIIVDLLSGVSRRVLDNHIITRSEVNHLVFGGKQWKNTVHSDGIALDRQNDILYIHALTGYTLYGVLIEDLLSGNINMDRVIRVETAAPDGMIMDDRGYLYFADLENNKIQYLVPDSKLIKTLVEGGQVKWADTFSLYDGYLYFTNSRINEAGGDISNLKFSINRVKIPK